MFSRNMLHQNPPTSTTTTTDDDETPSFYHPSASSSDSVLSLHRRRSNRTGQHVALMVVQTPDELTVDDEWDYSETERWGWVILATTWAVFVVGMGSCLGVWTWAWDVGETPYAPPELEDDPTLPITGYYPALMVCTAIMAWIWVVVAWVGMKFFRHSKVVGDES
jgi:fatty acid desaturase